MTKNRKFSRLKNPLVYSFTYFWSLDWAAASPLKQICRAGRTMYDVKEDNIVSHWNVRPSEVRGWSSQLSNYPQLCQTSVRHFVLRKLSDHLLWVRSPEKIFLQVLIFNNELQGRDASCELTLQDVSLDFLLLTVPREREREREGREVMKSVSGHPSYFSLEKVRTSSQLSVIVEVWEK